MKALKGFTLIEVLIVVAIVGILASIAFPSYRHHVIESRRLDAQAALLDAAQYMERQYSADNQYPSSIPSSLSGRVASYYTIDLDADKSGAQTYQISASPKASQADAKCGKLSINQAGLKSPSTAGCWK